MQHEFSRDCLPDVLPKPLPLPGHFQPSGVVSNRRAGACGNAQTNQLTQPPAWAMMTIHRAGNTQWTGLETMLSVGTPAT